MNSSAEDPVCRDVSFVATVADLATMLAFVDGSSKVDAAGMETWVGELRQ